MDLSNPSPVHTNTVFIGAGPAGLAVSAFLKRSGVFFILLEKNERIGPAWHRQYERLHLHTDKRCSELPYQPFPEGYPRYPSRQQVVDYLESYCKHFQVEPLFGQQVIPASRRDGIWITQTGTNTYISPPW